MGASGANRTALAVTIALCSAIDGGLFWLVVSATKDVADAIWVFIVTAGQPQC
jgi:hypothetical protein